jgi:hypothetical protein
MGDSCENIWAFLTVGSWLYSHLPVMGIALTDVLPITCFGIMKEKNSCSNAQITARCGFCPHQHRDRDFESHWSRWCLLAFFCVLVSSAVRGLVTSQNPPHQKVTINVEKSSEKLTENSPERPRFIAVIVVAVVVVVVVATVDTEETQVYQTPETLYRPMLNVAYHKQYYCC